MKNNQPPLLAQFVLALLTHPLIFAPSLSSGLRTVIGTSTRSAARAGVYNTEIFARDVDSGGVDMSGNELPAWSMFSRTLQRRKQAPFYTPTLHVGYVLRIFGSRPISDCTRLKVI